MLLLLFDRHTPTMNVEHNLILELVKGCFTPNLTCFAPQDALE